ncbi:hypothetical protein E8E11_011688 [Didymella keratinophila]|nr:hypothetical protein E8E11_011688 [Didymella keratinophila]
MSWKLTKKLKETHLAPLANTFSRSSSTSTIVDQQTPKAATSPGSSNATLADPNGIAASEANAAPPPAPLRPGILIVTLHEGKGFSLPPGAEAAFSGGSHHQGSLSQGGGFSVAGSMRPGSSRNPVVGSYTGHGRPQSAAGSINAAPTIHGRYSSKHLPYALVDFDKQQVFINAVSGTPENPLWAGGNTQYKFDVSRMTDLTVSLYIRNPTAPPNAGRNEDIFIGTLKINPRFEEQRDGKDKKGENIAAGQAGADWINVQFGSGQMKVGVNFVENRQDRLTIDDFDLLKVVGKGSFGKVMQVHIDWRKLLERKYEPSFKPNVVDAKDTANFDREFTSEAPTDSYVDGPMLSQTMQEQFAGWSYNRPVAGLGDAGGSVKDPSFEGVADRK